MGSAGVTKIFISYSHKDVAAKTRVSKHLNVLVRAGIALEIWDDRRIQAGDDWRQEIRDAIEGCSIALLLISADFLTSKFILDEEVPRLLERRLKEGVKIIPFIVAHCQWQLVPWLSPTQARPTDGRPLATFGKAKADEALSNLASEIYRLLTQLAAPKSSHAELAQAASPTFGGPAAVGSPRLPGAVANVGRQATALYGRQELLSRLVEGFAEHDVLSLYGFRGNGKTALIEQLQRLAPSEVPTEWVRVNAASEQSAAALFARLADALGERAERPSPPAGSEAAVAAQLLHLYPQPKSVVVWVDKAHAWFSRGEHWANQELGKLFRALRSTMATRWRWVLEMREKPGAALQSAGTLAIEVPGIDRAGLAEWLIHSAPAGQEELWRYSGDDLKRLYQWLGNRREEDRSQAANPMATRLMIEVATAHGTTPMHVLRRLLNTVEQRVDAALMSDLYDTVLNPQERELLNALALYRDAVPSDHIERLEGALGLDASWDGLERRCMLTTDANGERWYMLGFVAGWVRHRLGYPSGDDLWIDNGIPEEIALEMRQPLQRWHAVVAECWLHQLGGSRRVNRPNLIRAREAFHHLLCANRGDRLTAIAVELLGGPDEARLVQRLWDYNEVLRRKKAPQDEQITVLDLITRLDERDHKAWRYLSESLRRIRAPFEKVLRCCEKALALQPAFPPHVTNLGKVLLDHGPESAQAFLDRLSELGRLYPEVGNNGYVLSIAAQCLMKTGQFEKASQLRREQIQARALNSPFYNDEAKYQLSLGRTEEALRLLDLAQQLGVADAYTVSIRATALARGGQPEAASQLRREQIQAGSRHQSFYNDEANYQLSLNQIEEALRLLDLAEQRGAANAYTVAIRATAHARSGQPESASQLRREQIRAGAASSATYCDEAVYQLSLNQAEEALRVLDLARQRGAENDFILAVRTTALSQTGRPQEASQLRRERIDAMSREPAFYHDEAVYQLSLNKPDEALRLLDLAQQRAAASDYTLSIRAKVLARIGQPEAASLLRCQQIEAGSRHRSFYHDEAVYLLSLNEVEKAFALLDLAQQRGCSNDITLAIRATALACSGQPEAASQLRRAQIESGSRHEAFYHDEANYQLNIGHLYEAQQLLDQVDRLGLSNEISRDIQGKLNKSR